MQQEDWYARASCQGKAKELDFFPDEQDTAAVKAAQAVCWECQARLDCLDYALSHSIYDGIWGGLTGGDRRRFRRPRLFSGISVDVDAVADSL